MTEQPKVKFSKQPKGKSKQFTGKYYDIMKPIKDNIKKGHEVFFKKKFTEGEISEELWVKMKYINLNTEIITGALEEQGKLIEMLKVGKYVRTTFEEVSCLECRLVYHEPIPKKEKAKPVKKPKK